MSQVWIVVFPRSDKTKLDLVLAWDYEFRDYCIASRKTWPYEGKDEAIAYGVELADKHNLQCVGDLFEHQEHYLD
jgi:hypothetical protein